MITTGKHTIIPPGFIECYEGVELTLGAFCSIASGVKIISGQHPCIEHPECVAQYPFADEEAWRGVDYPHSKMGGFVTIGNDVWLGTDARILEGVTIGDGAIIGACSVIRHDVPSYAVMVGNPAFIKRRRRNPGVRWWEWDDDTIRAAIPAMKYAVVFERNWASDAERED